MEKKNISISKLSKDSCFQVPEGVTWRDIKGELITLQLDSGEYFSFNEIGRLAWIALAEGKTPAAVIAAVLAEYDVAEEQAEADVMAFLAGLLENNLLVPLVSPASPASPASSSPNDPV